MGFGPASLLFFPSSFLCLPFVLLPSALMRSWCLAGSLRGAASFFLSSLYAASKQAYVIHRS